MNNVLNTKEPYITYTPEISFLFVILSNNLEAFKWLLTKFISMGIDKTSTIEEIIWFDDYYASCPFIKCVDIRRKDIKYEKFTDFIEDSINKNYYVSLPVNIKFIHNYSENFSITHYLTSYGYDNITHQVYIMDHFKDGKFSFEQCSYTEINNAYDGIDSANNIFNYNLDVRMIRNIDGVKYDIDGKALIRVFQQFIDGIGLIGNNYERRDIRNKISDYNEICFGSKYYDALASLIIDTDKNLLLQRQIYLLSAHAKLLLGLAELIVQRYNINLVSNCNMLLNKNKIILNLYLKDIIMYKNIQIKTITKLYHYLYESRNLECSIMQNFIDGLKIL